MLLLNNAADKAARQDIPLAQRYRVQINQPFKTVALIFIMLCVVSCASNKDLDKGGASVFGGGFSVNEIEPGHFSILVKTNTAPVENFGAAKKSWEEHASKACNGKNYVAQAMRQDSYEKGVRFLGIVPYIVSEVGGIAVCEK